MLGPLTVPDTHRYHLQCLQVAHHFLLAAVNAAGKRGDVPAEDVRIWVKHAAGMYGKAENYGAYAR